MKVLFRRSRCSWLVFFVFSGLLVVFISSILLLIASRKIEIISKSNNKYKTHQYNPRNRNFLSPNIGSRKLPNRIIKENDFRYHEDNVGDSELISSFSEEKYECEGSCYCENSERRSSVRLISRSIRYLLFSVSAYIAFEKSKVFFEKQCIIELSNVCHSSEIQSTVEDCSVIKYSDSIEESDLEERTMGEEEEEEEEERIYFCYGNCAKNLNLRLPETEKYFKDVRCGELKKEGRVVINNNELYKVKQRTKTMNNEPSISMRFLRSARVKFQNEYLLEYCKAESNVKYEYVGQTTGANRRKYSYRVERSGFGCVAKSSYRGQRSPTRNVRCRQVKPVPMDKASAWRIKKWEKEKEEWDEGALVL